MENITIPQSDKGFNLNFTVKDDDGTAYDLTNYTVTLKIWNPGAISTLLINKTCSTDASATQGLCSYAVASTDFTTIGRYYAELELTKTGVIESTEKFIIIITESG